MKMTMTTKAAADRRTRTAPTSRTMAPRAEKPKARTPGFADQQVAEIERTFSIRWEW
jgi:hypothetical protein